MPEVQFQTNHKWLGIIVGILLITIGLGVSFHYGSGIPQEYWKVIGVVSESWEKIFSEESYKEEVEEEISSSQKVELEPALEIAINQLNIAISDIQYEEVWDKLHPDDQQRWGSKQNYVQTYAKYWEVLKEIGYSRSTYQIGEEIKELKSWKHPITGKEYTKVLEVTLKEIFSFRGEEINQNIKGYWQKINDSWRIFTSTNKEIIEEQIKIVTTIEGLRAIQLSGGIWENWDADFEKDGPVMNIIYLDSQGNNISNDSTMIVPISADVEVFTADITDQPYKKDKLIYSAHYSKEQIIFGDIYPKIRIPKEKMSPISQTDYHYGYVTVTIYTPAQGSFSTESDPIILYEE